MQAVVEIALHEANRQQCGISPRTQPRQHYLAGRNNHQFLLAHRLPSPRWVHQVHQQHLASHRVRHLAMPHRPLRVSMRAIVPQRALLASPKPGKVDSAKPSLAAAKATSTSAARTTPPSPTPLPSHAYKSSADAEKQAAASLAQPAARSRILPLKATKEMATSRLFGDGGAGLVCNRHGVVHFFPMFKLALRQGVSLGMVWELDWQRSIIRGILHG